MILIALLGSACSHPPEERTNLEYKKLIVERKSNSWARIEKPLPGVSQSIGRPNGGCLIGAQELDLSGNTWELMRPQKRRNFAHPELIEILKQLGAHIQSKSVTKTEKLLIGDLSQAAGGPLPFGDSSHQTGLDAEIWWMRLSHFPYVLDKENREKLEAKSILHADGLSLNSYWDVLTQEMLLWLASRGEVQAVYVNAAIKKKLCLEMSFHPGHNKIFADFGHEKSFRLRLLCPENSKYCTNLWEDASANSCNDDDLEQWFRPEILALNKKKSLDGKQKVFSSLPKACLRKIRRDLL